MKWLFMIDIENDLIVVCRVLGIFRRKGLKLQTLAMAATAEGARLTVLAEAPEKEIDHAFNFLRRSEGVSHAAYYRHTGPAAGQFVFVDSRAQRTAMAQWPKLFPGARLVLASHDGALLELPPSAAAAEPLSEFEASGLISFACVKNTRAFQPAAIRDRSLEASGNQESELV